LTPLRPVEQDLLQARRVADHAVGTPSSICSVIVRPRLRHGREKAAAAEATTECSDIGVALRTSLAGLDLGVVEARR